MIPNHPQFLEAIHQQKKVSVRFYSKPDSGLVDRICAPLDYGPGNDSQDGLNRYWLWAYAASAAPQTLGLVPQQIVDMQVLGEQFDPAQVKWTPSKHSIPRKWGPALPPVDEPPRPAPVAVIP